MKKVLVTGGTGFLGKHLIDSLVKENYEVISFDFRPPIENLDGVKYILGDIRDYGEVLNVAAGCEKVFHLAAIPSVARAKYETYYKINVLGTENVLRAAKETGINKLVYVSSSTVYGIPHKCPLTEDDIVENVGYYGKSKIKAEKLCWEYGTDKLIIIIIRPRVIMGAGRIGIFSLLFDAIMNNSSVYLIGKGQNIFQFTSIQDMVNSILLAVNYPKTQVFNIGSKDKTKVVEVIENLIKHAKSRSKIIPIPAWIARGTLKAASFLRIAPLVNEQFMIADKDFMLDTSRAEIELGWSPTQTNLDCLIEAFDWYKENQTGSKKQFFRILWVFGKFKHSQQGAFQDSGKGSSI